jgi:predicted phage-related endonuclease
MLDIAFFSSLKNTYLFYEGDRKVCFLYKYLGNKKFGEYEKMLENSPYYHKTIDVSNDKVLYVMDIPEELEDIIETFLEGKYSKLPNPEELICFLKFHYGADENSRIVRIIRKDHKLKKEIEELIGQSIGDLDLASIPDCNKENFTKDLYEKKPEHDDIWEDNNIPDKINTKGDS